MQTIKTLVELFNSKGYNYYQTDKNTVHSYLETYEKLFNSYKDEDIVFLEVGVREGGSIRLWGDYFTKATIYGISSFRRSNRVCKKVLSCYFKWRNGNS